MEDKILLQPEQRVKRNDDGMLGTIEKHGHTFGHGKNKYEAYWVRWDDGKLGYPSESSFEPVNSTV